MSDDKTEQCAATAIYAHPMSEYSVLYHDTDKGHINVGVVMFDGAKLSIRFCDTNVAVRRFCELVGTKMPASFDRAKEQFRRRMWVYINEATEDEKNTILAVVANEECGSIRLTDPLWVSSHMSIDALFADCVAEIKADAVPSMLSKALLSFDVLIDAQLTEAQCDTRGHAPRGTGQCDCGWRGEDYS